MLKDFGSFESESAVFSIFCITSAVLTGNVLFSTTIVWPLEYLATCLAQASTHFKSLDFPAPSPLVFVCVFTEMNIISEDFIDSFILVLKNKFLFHI